MCRQFDPRHQQRRFSLATGSQPESTSTTAPRTSAAMAPPDNSTATLEPLSGKQNMPANEGESANQDAKLAELLSRIQQITSPDTRKNSPPTPAAAATAATAAGP